MQNATRTGPVRRGGDRPLSVSALRRSAIKDGASGTGVGSACCAGERQSHAGEISCRTAAATRAAREGSWRSILATHVAPACRRRGRVGASGGECLATGRRVTVESTAGAGAGAGAERITEPGIAPGSAVRVVLAFRSAAQRAIRLRSGVAGSLAALAAAGEGPCEVRIER
jgi:hypothetical protein